MNNSAQKKEGGGVSATAPKTAPAPTPAWENPLIPSKKLRQLYTAMVELRLLEEHLATRQSRKKAATQFAPHRGEEACLVSTVLSLLPGDLTSESQQSAAIAMLRGAKLKTLLDRPAAVSGSSGTPSTELPPLADTSARLHLAVGAALAQVAAAKKGSLTVAYVHAGDLTLQQWKPILKLAAAQPAAILFVVLPASGKLARSGQLSLTADTSGVPGIPVDASDPIALYRVAQESMLRIRAGGGPVLMECIPFQLPGKRSEPTDPIRRMEQLLLPRGIATEAWFGEVATRFASRLKAFAANLPARR